MVGYLKALPDSMVLVVSLVLCASLAALWATAIQKRFPRLVSSMKKWFFIKRVMPVDAHDVGYAAVYMIIAFVLFLLLAILGEPGIPALCMLVVLIVMVVLCFGLNNKAAVIASLTVLVVMCIVAAVILGPRPACWALLLSALGVNCSVWIEGAFAFADTDTVTKTESGAGATVVRCMFLHAAFGAAVGILGIALPAVCPVPKS
jgi:hypothetical protein